MESILSQLFDGKIDSIRDCNPISEEYRQISIQQISIRMTLFKN